MNLRLRHDPRTLGAAAALTVLALISVGCSDDEAETQQLPPGLTMPSTSTSTTTPAGSTTTALDASGAPVTEDANTPLDSFTGVFRSTVVLGPADDTGAATVVDVCGYLEEASGATTSLLFGSDEDRPVTDVSGLIDDGQFGYVVPDGHDPGTDHTKYAADTNLLRPGVKAEIQGSAGEIDPADAGTCPPGTNPNTIIAVEKWQILPS